MNDRIEWLEEWFRYGGASGSLGEKLNKSYREELQELRKKRKAQRESVHDKLNKILAKPNKTLEILPFISARIKIRIKIKYTFHGRYTRKKFTIFDHREPLNCSWGSKYAVGFRLEYVFDSNTNVKPPSLPVLYDDDPVPGGSPSDWDPDPSAIL